MKKDRIARCRDRQADEQVPPGWVRKATRSRWPVTRFHTERVSCWIEFRIRGGIVSGDMARIAHALLVIAAWLLVASGASAHPTPGSVASVDFTVDGARLEQDVPVEELERALHRTIHVEGQATDDSIRRLEPVLRPYAAAHVGAVSVDGERPWSVTVLDVTGHDASDGPRALFRFALRAPDVASGGAVRLHDDLVAHEVISHTTTVFVRSDWAVGGGAAGPGGPRLVGAIHAGHHDVVIARAGSFARGLRSIVALGMEHIATGTDHLLFLFALLLVAPVGAVRGRWRERRPMGDALRSVAGVVTAFTLGHSATLAIGVLGGAVLPASVVEAAIAVSVLVTAVHAARPVFPRREALVAGAFGLVHGLAFASTLAGRDLGRAQTAWTLLGFNVGVELAQVGLLVLVLPWLLLLASTRVYGGFRLIGAGVTATLAVGWLLERTTSWPSPFARPLGWMEAHPLGLLFALAALTVVARLTEHRDTGDALTSEGARQGDPTDRDVAP